jgi:hypothetical protein
MNIIFGLGSGRCGTNSLAKLLNNQPQTQVGNETIISEYYPPNKNKLLKLFKIMKGYKKEFVGEVAHWYLNYVPMILDINTNTKFICLKRNKLDTVNSYVRKVTNINGVANHWTIRSSKHWQLDYYKNSYSIGHPEYDLPMIEALNKYWDEYYEKADYYENCYRDNFRIVIMEHIFSNKDTQTDILKFLGYKKYNIILGIKENSTML